MIVNAINTEPSQTCTIFTVDGLIPSTEDSLSTKFEFPEEKNSLRVHESLSEVAIALTGVITTVQLAVMKNSNMFSTPTNLFSPHLLP
jgi:acetylglutamate synthase